MSDDIPDEIFIDMHSDCENQDKRNNLPFHRRVKYMKGNGVIVITTPNYHKLIQNNRRNNGL